MPDYVIPLSSSAADVRSAGGKGANLAKLVQAGFDVPGGFIVTTAAYGLFLSDSGIGPQVLELAEKTSRDSTAEELSSVAACIRELFAAHPVPRVVAEAVRTEYGVLGESAPVAVRSSATVEDLPGLAFPGQHDTFLNMMGESSVLEAIRSCWASLWTARAIAYRNRAGVAQAGIEIAVVVQTMVAADSSGVAFSANPVTGRRDEVVIDASFGLGEAVVSGAVEPDRYVVDGVDGAITSRRLGAKQVEVVALSGGGTEQVRGGRKDEAALTDNEIVAVALAARHIAGTFGEPQDVEWAWERDRLRIVQSRPITSLYPLPVPAEAADGLRVYLSANHIQGLMDPITPLGISTLRLVLGGIVKAAGITTHAERVMRVAGERIFADITVPVVDPNVRHVTYTALANVEPVSRDIVSQLVAAHRIPTARKLQARDVVRLVAHLLPIAARVLRAVFVPKSVRRRGVATADAALATARERVQSARDLPQLLDALETDLSGVGRLGVHIMPVVLAGVASMHATGAMLREWLGEPEATALTLARSLPGNPTVIMDLDLWDVARSIAADHPSANVMRGQPVVRIVADYRRATLPEVAQREIGRFLTQWGARGVAEIDFGRDPWRDDPTGVVSTLKGYLQLSDSQLAPDVVFSRGAELAERQAADLVDRVRATRHGWLRALLLRAAIRRLRAFTALRELPKLHIVRLFDLYREALLVHAHAMAAKGVISSPRDVFFVPLAELRAWALGSQVNLRPIVDECRAAYRRELSRPRVPRVLLSSGEAFYDAARTGPADATELLGEAVSPGIAEGRVRVVLEPSHAALEPGEILVCPSTDPAWTPLFLIAAGLVMEIGGLVTHGSIVAREYGIPAVVGVANATERLVDGDLVRVDGNSGTVTVLEAVSVPSA